MDVTGRIDPMQTAKTTIAYPTIARGTVYADRSFSYITKTPPAAVLLKRAAKIEKGSGVPNRDKVGIVTAAQLREIAESKMEDLNADDIDAAARMIAGTARSMGLVVEG